MRTSDALVFFRTIAEQLGRAFAKRERLRTQSIRDALTGLFDRRHLEETLVRGLARAARAGRSSALIIFDVDHFKRLNEFVVIFPEVDLETPGRRANRLREAIEAATITHRDRAVGPVTVSIGVALASRTARSRWRSSSPSTRPSTRRSKPAATASSWLPTCRSSPRSGRSEGALELASRARGPHPPEATGHPVW